MVKLTQRHQYQKSLIARIYWDFRDQQIFKFVVGKKIIDLGCGEGVTLEKIIKKFPAAQIIGVDNDPKKIKICRQHHLPVKLADIAHLPFKTNSFDCALLIEVIEHLEVNQVNQAVKEIRRILRPGGRLIVLFPNDRNFKIGRLLTLKLKEAFYDYGHVRQWQPAEAIKLFQKAGFQIVDQRSLPVNFWLLGLHHLLALEAMAAGAAEGH